jgi:hypothetical protein
LWEATARGPEAAAAVAEEIRRVLDEARAVEAGIAALGIQSHDQLVAAANTAKAVADAVIRGVETGQYTQEQANLAYLNWQKALAAAGDAAAQAWLRAHDAAQAGEQAADSATAALQQQRDQLAQSIANEAPEEIMGVTEAAIRGQIDALDAQIAAATEAASTTEQAFDESLGQVQKDFDATAGSAQQLEDEMRRLFGDLSFRIPIHFDVDPVPVIPMASGGSGVVTRPTLFLAGEAGPERFSFSRTNGSGHQEPGSSGSHVAQPLIVQLRMPNGHLTEVVIDDILKDKRGAGTMLRRGLRH